MIDPLSHGGGDLFRRLSYTGRGSEPLRANTCSAVLGIGFVGPTAFRFQRFSLVRHLAPTASQIEVRYSKYIISCLSGATPALVDPLPTFVSTIQHHCYHSSHFRKRTNEHSSHASAEKTHSRLS
jgi:hypothetical protein